MKKRYTEEQVIGFLTEADAGLDINELCRKYGFSQGSYYAWKAKFGGMNVSEALHLDLCAYARCIGSERSAC